MGIIRKGFWGSLLGIFLCLSLTAQAAYEFNDLDYELKLRILRYSNVVQDLLEFKEVLTEYPTEDARKLVKSRLETYLKSSRPNWMKKRSRHLDELTIVFIELYRELLTSA